MIHFYNLFSFPRFTGLYKCCLVVITAANTFFLLGKRASLLTHFEHAVLTDGSDLLSSLIWKIILAVDVLTHHPHAANPGPCVLRCHGHPCLPMNSAPAEPKQSHTDWEEFSFHHKSRICAHAVSLQKLVCSNTAIWSQMSKELQLSSQEWKDVFLQRSLLQ